MQYYLLKSYARCVKINNEKSKKEHSLMKTVSLKTEYETLLCGCETPFSDYPRPQLRRDSYLCLNGLWDFSVENRNNKGVSVYNGKILVPFVPESRISGVMRALNAGEVMRYKRIFTLDPEFIKDRVILHIGACDQIAEVYINGIAVGVNIGGYNSFSFDITDKLRNGENELMIIAWDDLDKELPYGKQTYKRGGMWYTKISGIWQTVWLESVCDNYIEKLRITPDMLGVEIEIFGGEDEKTLIFEGREYRVKGGKFRLDVENPINWTPDTPHLYDFTVISGGDRVDSYFALRTVGIKDNTVLLNGEPIFMHGLLDQGYFSDGIFLPATSKGYEDDILRMKKCGFNTLRKHIKAEPDIFYYYCDKYGMLVWQDFINSGKYSFLLDTALPTLFLKKGITHKASPFRRREFLSAAYKIIDSLYNHPSVIYYTVFNEGWGQFDADNCYETLKSKDPTRIFDTASGWFKPKKSDVESEHIYFKPIRLSTRKKPLVLSEYGGYSYRVEGHIFNLDKNYGYKSFKAQADFENALISLFDHELVGAIENGLCGAIYTQLSDVEDETNGLLTYDRAVLKVDPTCCIPRFKKISRKMAEK